MEFCSAQKQNGHVCWHCWYLAVSSANTSLNPILNEVRVMNIAWVTENDRLATVIIYILKYTVNTKVLQMSKSEGE